MLRLGIIGTHTISDQMIHAAQDTGKYQLTAIYSRKLSTAEAFGNKYGLRDTLMIDSIFDTKKVTYLNNQGGIQVINNHYLDNTMVDELNDFAKLFTNPESPQQQNNYQRWLELAKIINMTLYRLRKSANIIFPSDY